jgi:hypothetical protein
MMFVAKTFPVTEARYRFYIICLKDRYNYSLQNVNITYQTIILQHTSTAVYI